MPAPNLPLNVEPLALDLVQAALELEESANSCALNPVPGNFDAMMVSMRAMRQAIDDAYRWIAA